MRLSLTNAIFLGIALAIILGLIANFTVSEVPNPDAPSEMMQQLPFWARLLKPLCILMGQIFLLGIKMLVAPLILTAIVAGISSIPAKSGLARLGLKTLIYYAVTTSIAVFIGIMVVNVVRPGEGKTVDEIREQLGAALEQAELTRQTIEVRADRPKGPEDLIQNLLTRCLSNPFTALSSTNVLGIITFSLLIGLMLPRIGPRGQPLIELFQSAFELMIRLVYVLLWTVPFGAFGLLFILMADVGLGLFVPLGSYCASILIAIGIHALIVLPLILIVFGKMKPSRFYKGYREALAVAFSTTSSSATLPISMRCAEKNLGVPNHTASFVLPLGATVNMDGTALYEAVAVMFIAQVIGVPLSFSDQIIIFIMAVFAGIGAASIPSAGLVTMFMVFAAVGVDPIYIAFIIPVDHVLDMFRTTTNVIGDGVGAVVIARSEGEDLEANAAAWAASP